MCLWRSMIFRGPSLCGLTSEQWLRFYEAYWASGEQEWMRDASRRTVWPSGLIVCGVSGQRWPLCVVTVVTEGLLAASGLSSRGPTSIWHHSWRSWRFPRRKLCRANKILMIISLHSFLWDYHHFAGNWSDELTAQQSSLHLLFVKYCRIALPHQFRYKQALFWRLFLVGFSVFPALPLSHFCPSPSIEEGVMRLKSNQLN